MNSIEMGWLPMGTVVKVKDSDCPIMVTDRMVCQAGGADSKIWEYAGCLYPGGNKDSDHTILFDGSRVEHVLFIGYRTEAELAYCRALTEAKAGLGRDERGRPAE